MRPTIRQLEYLTAIDAHEHLGRAAEACFVSPPTISVQIRELEKHLGVAVAERVGRGIVMTAAGRELAEHARTVLRDADELVESARRSATALVGPLRVAAIPTVAPYLLPRLLPSIRKRHPDAGIRLTELRTHQLTASLTAADIDVGLLALPVGESRLEHAVVLDDRFLLAMAPNHPLARKPKVSVQELQGQTVLLLEDGHCLTDQVRELCSRVGAFGDGSMQGTSMATVCQMVATGVGVTLLPASARAVDAPEGGGVVVRPFDDVVPCRHVALVWRRHAPAAALYRELAVMMAGELADGRGPDALRE